MKTPRNYKLAELENRVDEIARKFCPDYPGLDSCSTFEQLYAIESTLEGWQLALSDWANVVQILMSKHNIPLEEVEQMFNTTQKTKS